ncbi:c-type cytochrome [Jannaschia donghaensis]|uniref:Cytochrome c oxidase, cbb3-type, subunit III n=1 Tax=Jannaschia donghaensis TaxID=420998 RepID=A0A0M6YDV3_9RHOB|nr:c-type cytochrome [Jannaschia donghaensis]CTQ48160.1 cytochrome c oxidase, cbb3-type, subunit III [Jannaschia donghaensis]
MPAFPNLRISAFLLAPLALGACNAADEPRTDAAHGASLFAQNCAACHGADGAGAGGIGPDLTSLSRRNGGDFPRDRVLAQIDGLNRHGDAGAVMPEFGAGDLGPAIIVEEHDGLGTPIPSDLIALTEYLRTIQR